MMLAYFHENQTPSPPKIYKIDIVNLHSFLRKSGFTQVAGVGLHLAVVTLPRGIWSGMTKKVLTSKT